MKARPFIRRSESRKLKEKNHYIAGGVIGFNNVYHYNQWNFPINYEQIQWVQNHQAYYGNQNGVYQAPNVNEDREYYVPGPTLYPY